MRWAKERVYARSYVCSKLAWTLIGKMSTMVSFRKQNNDGCTTWIVQRNEKMLVFPIRNKTQTRMFEWSWFDFVRFLFFFFTARTNFPRDFEKIIFLLLNQRFKKTNFEKTTTSLLKKQNFWKTYDRFFKKKRFNNRSVRKQTKKKEN